MCALECSLSFSVYGALNQALDSAFSLLLPICPGVPLVDSDCIPWNLSTHLATSEHGLPMVSCAGNSFDSYLKTGILGDRELIPW